ncbi:hypothetical protein KAR91_42315 [Candidatus Pacearchaeota archaeon]|nr:hypothetical protein [Candidatus Pacearchaeota archaeon]
MKKAKTAKGFRVTPSNEKAVIITAMAYTNAGLTVKREGVMGIKVTFPKGLPISRKADLLKRAKTLGTPMTF